MLAHSLGSCFCHLTKMSAQAAGNYWDNEGVCYSQSCHKQSRSSKRHSSKCTAIAVGSKIETLLSFFFVRTIAMEIFLRLSEIQMNLGMSVIKTQEALIIKIAHKTVNNTMFMFLLLDVNSNCYCGHLGMEKKERKVEQFRRKVFGCNQTWTQALTSNDR